MRGRHTGEEGTFPAVDRHRHDSHARTHGRTHGRTVDFMKSFIWCLAAAAVVVITLGDESVGAVEENMRTSPSLRQRRPGRGPQGRGPGGHLGHVDGLDGPMAPRFGDKIKGVKDLVNKFKALNLVGKSGEEAEAVIKSIEPSMSTFILDEDAMVTADHNINRVRIFVDKQGKVARQPRVG